MSPSELDILCEHCGYVLNNLPGDGRCPECGALIAESSPTARVPSLWEQDDLHRWRAFFKTTYRVIFSPTRFFRSLAIAVAEDRAGSFAMICCMIASAFFGAAAGAHLQWVMQMSGHGISLHFPAYAALAMLSYVILAGVTKVAARLTSWEASYRGLRMPLSVVRRGMRYHTAHYLPVSVLSCFIVFGYEQLHARLLIDASHDLEYLYALSGAVVLSSVYLFYTYWIGMRNLMYANR